MPIYGHTNFRGVKCKDSEGKLTGMLLNTKSRLVFCFSKYLSELKDLKQKLGQLGPLWNYSHNLTMSYQKGVASMPKCWEVYRVSVPKTST